MSKEVTATKVPEDLVAYRNAVERLIDRVDGHLSLGDKRAIEKLPEAKALKEAWNRVLERHGGNWKEARAEYLRAYPVQAS